MQRQRGDLVPIGEAFSDLSGPVAALRDALPQARRGFTVADQVHQLVTAREADADLGFMARMMALCSLPRTNAGNRLQYRRVNGPYTLIMTATGKHKLPFGNFPRLLLAAIIHKFGVSVDFLRKFRAESVFRCDYKASKLVEPNRDEARAPSGNSSARRGLYICVGAGSQGTVRWDTDGASVMRRAFVRDKTMPGAPRCDEKFPEPGHRF